MGELPVVVKEADQAEADHDHHHQPDTADGEVRPEECGDGYGEDDQDAAHRRRSLFVEVRARSILPDGLTDPEILEPADQPGADDETDHERRDRRVDGPECDVSENIEKRIGLM